MGEGSRRGFGPESRPGAPESDIELEDAVSPTERLIAERWNELNKSLEAFKETMAEDTLEPERFVAETTEAWEARHDQSEYVDINDPFERVGFLLAQLSEKGPEWSTQKKAAVRRVLFGYANRAYGAMTLPQQGILDRTILKKSDDTPEINPPKAKEKEVIKQWMQDTVGRGVPQS